MTKKKAAIPNDAVTLREIEAASPCSREYQLFLRAIKSNCVDSRYARHEEFPSPQFGPDDPIPLELIASTKPSSSGSFNGRQRIDWIGNHVGRIQQLIQTACSKKTQPIRNEIARLETQLNEIDENSWKVLLPEKPKKKKAA